MVFTVRFLLGVILLLIACVPLDTAASWRFVRQVEPKENQNLVNQTSTEIEEIKSDYKPDSEVSESRIVNNKDLKEGENAADKTETKPKTEAISSEKYFKINALDVSDKKPIVNRGSTKFLSTTESSSPSTVLEKVTSTTENDTKDGFSNDTNAISHEDEKQTGKENARSENSRSLDIDIDKYTSEQFHNRNNVYSLPTSEENKKYISTDFSEFKFTTHSTVDFSEIENFSTDLTTPKSEFFDSKHRQIEEGVQQNLEAIDDDFRSSEQPASKTTDNELNIQDLANKVKNNETKSNLEYLEYKQISLNESATNNSKHSDVVSESGVKLNFNSTYNDTKIIDEQNVIPLAVPDDVNGKTLNSEEDSVLEKAPKIQTEKPIVDPVEQIEENNEKIVSLKTEKGFITKPPKLNEAPNSILSNKIETGPVKSAEELKNKWEIAPTSPPTTASVNDSLPTTLSKENPSLTSTDKVDVPRESTTVDKRGTIKYQHTITSIDASQELFGSHIATTARAPINNHITKSYQNTEQTVLENQIIPIKILPPTTTQKAEVVTSSLQDNAVNTTTTFETTTETSLPISSTLAVSSSSINNSDETSTTDNVAVVTEINTEYAENGSTTKDFVTSTEMFTSKMITMETTSTATSTLETSTLEATTSKAPFSETSTLDTSTETTIIFVNTTESTTELNNSTEHITLSTTDNIPTTSSDSYNLTTTLFLDTTIPDVNTTTILYESTITDVPSTTLLPYANTISRNETKEETTTTVSITSFSHVVNKVEATTEKADHSNNTLPYAKPEENSITEITKPPEVTTTKNITEQAMTTTETINHKDNTIINNEYPKDEEHAIKYSPTEISPVKEKTSTIRNSIPVESSTGKDNDFSVNSVLLTTSTTYKVPYSDAETEHSQETYGDIDDSNERKPPELHLNPTSTPNLEHSSTKSENEDVRTTLTEELTTIVEGLQDGAEEDDGGGTVIAIVISCVGAICLVLLVGLLIVMRKRQKRFNYPQMCKPVDLDSYNMDNMFSSSRRKGVLRTSKRSYGNPAFEDPISVTRPLNFQALAKFTSQEEIKAEFDEIPQVTARTNELPEGCEVKNRYANVIPLPESRVFLKEIEGYQNSDYINANYVAGAKSTKGYYIACQAPMANTVDDFWRMVWEQQSKVILMLTHLYENGVEKCTDYLPPSEVVDCHRLFGDYQVTLKKRDVKDKYIISTLQLKNMVSNSWREVTHLWYLGWPEKGVPYEANSLIAFLIEARSFIKTAAHSNPTNTNGANGNIINGAGNTNLSPVIVHCSPGTGRTGTVIACDIAIREFEQSRLVDIPKIVYKIRRDRASSVQSREQYAFIYKVITLYATKLTGGALDSL